MLEHNANMRIFNDVMPNLHTLTYNFIKVVIYFLIYFMQAIEWDKGIHDIC